jgi:uncharacterized SAM-binding protein YcdF (DUF218 family)
MSPRPEQSERGGVLFSLIALLCVAAICAAIYLARHPLMRFAAESWVVEDTLEKSDAIVVLGDDNFYADRATRAVELYRQGLAPLVVAGGRRLRPYAAAAELIQHDLVERGVPRESVLVFPYDAADTLGVAQAIAALTAEKRWHRIIIVTSNYDTRRARYIFLHVIPASTQVSVASAHDGSFDPEHWYEHRASVKRFVLEVGGMAAAMWELHHVNAPSAPS